MPTNFTNSMRRVRRAPAVVAVAAMVIVAVLALPAFAQEVSPPASPAAGRAAAPAPRVPVDAPPSVRTKASELTKKLTLTARARTELAMALRLASMSPPQRVAFRLFTASPAQRKAFEAFVKPKPKPPVVAPDRGAIWDRLAFCESSGNWAYNGGSGFDGGLQFHPGTWTAYGGGQFAPYAWGASREQQIVIAEKVLAGQGWGAWPGCARKLGLR